MITLRIIATIFIAFFISRAYLRFKDKLLSLSNFIFWLMIWISTLVFIFDPELSSFIAKIIGLGRGADALFLLSIILLFYLVFRLYVKIDMIDKNLTTFVIEASKIKHREQK